MKKKLLTALFAIAGVAAATTASADGTNSVKSTNWADRWADTWDSGVYLKGNVGHSNLRHLKGFEDIRINNSSNSAGAAVGYQFNQFIGAEVGYKYLGDFSTQFGDIKGDTWDFALVGKYPVAHGFSATAKAGVALTEARFAGERSRNTTAVYGLGVEYDLNKKTALTTGWDRYHNMADTGHKLDNVSIGLKYKF